MNGRKIFWLALLAACLLMSLTACAAGSSASAGQSSPDDPSAADGQNTASQGQVPEQDAEEPPQSGTAGVLVAYFSATGNTKGVAEQIADLTGGDLYEIVPSEPYTDEDLDYTNPDSRSQVEGDDPAARPAIGSELADLDGYATVYLGYPIWNGQAPKIISTFLESYDFSGITIVPFCTSASSGIGSSAESLEPLADSAEWLEGERFDAEVSASDIQAWLDGLGL